VDGTVRIDKWLWATRFFKTRGKAREAIVGGKVQLDGHRVKPGKTLQVGDQLRIQRGLEEFNVEVVQLTTRRGPASEAQSCYREDAHSRARREAAAAERALQRQQHAGRERRPDKRERRHLIRFRQGQD
jgi:ribosome-associated heat shock protein Hsp15